MWADSKLVYDATSGTDTVRRPGFVFRFYPGNETQLPDSTIEADKGAGNVPAFRGLCYVVFSDLPLEDYGNRIPNLTYEIAVESTEAFLYQPLTLLTGGANQFTNADQGTLAIDYRRGFGYITGSGGPGGDNGIRRFTLNNMVEDRQALCSAINADGSTDGYKLLTCGPDGTLYALRGYAGIWRIDPNTMKETTHFPGSIFPGGTSDTQMSTPVWLATALTYTALGNKQFVICGSLFNAIMVLTDRLEHVWHHDMPGYGILGLTDGLADVGLAEVYVMSGGTYTNFGHVYINRLRLKTTPTSATLLDTVVENKLLIDVDPNAIEAGCTQFWANNGGLCYDATDDTILFGVNVVGPGGGIGNTYLTKWDRDGNLIWKTQLPVWASAGQGAQSRIQGGLYSLMQGTQIVQVESSTGDIVYNESWGAWFQNGPMVCDGQSGNIIVPSFANGWAKLYVNRHAGNTVVIGDVIADACTRAGFDASDIDTGDVTESVTGYAVTQQDSAANVITLLARIYLLDGVERDDQLVFKNRGGPVVATVTEDELIRLNDTGAEPYVLTRKQEPELPYRVTLTYYDAALDYQSNTQQAQRARKPDPVVFSDNETALQLPAVLTADAAKQQAEKLLFAAWMGRNAWQVRLPQTYLWLDASDAITLAFNSGFSVRARLSNADVGVDFSLDTVLISESTEQYTSTATGAAGLGFDGQTIEAVVNSELFLLDTPLLRDTDDNLLVVVGYWAAAPYSDTTWRGAQLQESPDNTAWNDYGTTLTEAAWGYVLTPPADPQSFFRPQRDGTLRVDMLAGGGEMSSITDLQLANGFNSAVLFKTNGDVEIIQFRDVTHVTGTIYDLSWLMRGRRGTDTMGTGHVAGERIMLISSATTQPLAATLASRNVPLSFRAVTFGQLPEAAFTESMTFTGRDKKPYAPVHVAAALSGSDIVLTWVRRTRVGGALLDGTGDVPLSEASEAYEVDILSGPGGTVLRTLTGITSPAVTYTAAQIAADFGATPSSLSVVVYQLSAIVGRGFGREDRIEVR